MKIYQDDKKYKSLFNPITTIPDIPIELLSKYYARMYTINGNFFEKMKRDLLIDYNKNNILYQSYIKTIYEVVEKKALKTLDSFENLQLYSAQYFTEKQIKEINDYRQNTVDYYQVPIVYSKLFFSFTKDIRVAEYFLQNYQKNTLLTIVGANKEYNLNSHAQIEDLSSFKEEQEVLFFPFSAFGIEDFIYDPKQKIYNIKLLYLGRFLKEYEIKDIFNIKTDKLPENYFIKLFKKSGLIDKGVISKMKVKEVKSEQNSKKVCNCMILKHFISLIIAISALVIIGIVLLIYFLTKKEEECNAGQYYSSNLSKCLNCSIGYFSSKGAKSCSRCPEGETSSIGSCSCSKCEARTFSNETIFECQPCQNGTYSEEGASFCIMCEPGFYSERGASKCEKCSKGTISSHHGASHCNNCHAGEYPNENQNDCIPCEPGSYSNEGDPNCTKCPKGKYQAFLGSTVCLNCPPGSYTDYVGSIVCKKCPDGTNSRHGASLCF